MDRKIDTGGLSQFYTGCQEQSPVMVLEYTLRKTVNPAKLQTAVRMALDVFLLFRVRLVLNEKRQPIYELNELSPCVYESDDRPHAFGKESRGYLFRISYKGSRISLSIHHMLTDFLGANEFLKYILRCYLHLSDKSIVLSKDTISLDLSDLRDPYDLYGNISSKGYNMADRWENELFIPNSMLYRRCEPHLIRQIVFPAEKILLAAKKTDSSVFPLLSWFTANALAATYHAEDKILVGRGAANYRAIYASRTPLCFSQSFKTVLLPEERSLDLETQLTVQRFRMDLKLQRRTTDREVALRREAVRQMDGPIEEYVMDQEMLDQERRIGETKSAFFLSYPGKLDLPDELSVFVESCNFSSTSTRGPLSAVAYSWKGNISICVSEVSCEKSIIPEMREILKKYGIESQLTGLCEKSYDYYPMEELVSSNSTLSF